MTGTTLGPYRVGAQLGAGGMGEVYRATDTRLERDVAIKVLPMSVADDPDRLARFEREARAVAALSHPNILSIFDVGEARTAEGAHVAYAVMELLDGQSLRERLEEGPLPVRKAIDYAIQIARGLAAAHEKGLTHRDIKPENVFLLPDGHVKILDFGLARTADSERREPRAESPTVTSPLTDPGTVLGTVGYMSPEQVRGHGADPRSDLFSFGAVLYEMVAGRRAFQADTAAETMTAILREDPPEILAPGASIPPALDRIIRHCLEKSPGERFQSARDVAFALSALSGTGAGSGVGTGTGAVAAIDAPAARPSAGTRAGALGAGAILIALVAGAVGYVAGGGSGTGQAAIADVTYQPVTFDEGFVFAGRFAQDGRTIVFSADWEGQSRDVFVTSVDSPESRALGFIGADLLALSRDGELGVLAGSEVPFGNPYIRRGTLARAALTGGTLRPELEHVFFADIAPDGERAVVRRPPGEPTTLEYPVGTVLDDRSDFHTPRVAPDGAHVAAFMVDPQDTRMVVRIYERGGGLVAESRGFFDWWSLAWAGPDELWLAATEEEGSQVAVFAMNLAGQERLVFRAPGALTIHDISSEGDLLASFDQYRSRVELVGGASGALTDRSWKEDPRPVGLAADGSILLTQTGDSGGPNGSAYAWRPGEPQPVRIAEGAAVALSPDGRQALVRQAGAGLALVPTGVGRPSPLDLAGASLRGWAGVHPDGRVLFSGEAADGRSGVFALRPAGGGVARLLPEGYQVEGGNMVSPDGSRLAAFDPQGTLVACVFASGDCRPVAGHQAGEEVAGWAADNRSIFVFRRQRVPVEIVRLDVESGLRTPSRTLAPTQAAVSGLRSVLAAPDGTIVYSYSRARTQLYVIRGLR